MIDKIYKKICVEFCSSLVNFITSVKFYKYEGGITGTPKDTIINNEDSVDGYKYLVNYFCHVDNEIVNPIGLDTSEHILDIKRKWTDLSSDITLMKSFFEIKQILDNTYGENYFTENEIVRYVVGYVGNTSCIKKAMDELYQWRKSTKPMHIKAEEFTNINKDTLFILSEDKHRRPVIVCKPGLLVINNDNIHIYTRYVIFTLDKAIDMYEKYINS